MEQAQQAVQSTIARTMVAARRIIDDAGVTAPTLRRLEGVLRELATTPALIDQVSLQRLHESAAAATVLASEGRESLTLVLARFGPEAPTPVHDHGTWGVACVVTGQDHYRHWVRLDDGRDPERAQIRVQDERVLGPGDTVSWLGPPHDIHSQQGQRDAAWELVLFGRDALRLERHYFDPVSARVRVARPA